MSRGPLEWVRVACITVLGSGYAPFAPGSWGSLTAIVLFLPLLGGMRGGWVTPYGLNGLLTVGIAVACLLSILWGDWAIARFGRKDPKPFVLDEFAGQWVALLALPLDAETPLPVVIGMLASQFVFFRILDVLKPPPARQMERLPAGWGILLDDLFAGLYANLAGQALWRWTASAAWLTAAGG